jgi:predicted ATP-dependent endonuclease of OLD family
MKLVSCRVTNYRSIDDSGWVEIDDISVIVGKNESGKTSFLKALSKFKPFNPEVRYDIDREWPSLRRREKDPNSIVVSIKFSFSQEERDQIAALYEPAMHSKGVSISISYSGARAFDFSPEPIELTPLVIKLSFLREKLNGIAPGSTSEVYSIFHSWLEENIPEDDEESIDEGKMIELLEDLKAAMPDASEMEDDEAEIIVILEEDIDALLAWLRRGSPMLLRDFIENRIPTFIYMDDHRAFAGSALLDEVLRHKKENKLTEEEETILIIMGMAELNLEDEVKKGQAPKRDQRMLDMEDASYSLTKLISERWSQRRYDVVFKIDGQHFMTFVKDASNALVPLEDRSKGFQWFFSFDMRFMYETEGAFENSVILLDEPGLHLHASAQKDLLNRLREYSKKNQLIYTTHLPFMVDLRRLDNIYVAEEIEGRGVIIHKDWATADKDSRFTLQAALGVTWSQSLFVGQYNLVVEGVDDFWLLTVFSELFTEAGQKGIDPDLVITPAGGASKVAYVGTLLKGQNLNVAAILDSDLAGKDALQQIVHNWIVDDKAVLLLGDIIKVDPCALEDLFGEVYYIEKVMEAYSKELKKKPLTLDANTAGNKIIVDRVQDAFNNLKLGKFNKGRVAKKIMASLGKMAIADINPETSKKFRKVIDAINDIVHRWKSNS